MAEVDSMQTTITQAAIQVASAMLMALKKVDTGPARGANWVNAGDMHRSRHGRTTLNNQHSIGKLQI